MKLTSVHLDNWLAHAYRELELAPLTIIAGPNHSGKSSVRDGVRYVFTGALGRVASKADRDQLANDATGRKAGKVVLTHAAEDGATGTFGRDLAGKMLYSGAALDLDGAITGPALEIVLNPAALAAMDGDARRTALLTITATEIGADAVLGELKKRTSPEIIAKLKESTSLEAWRKTAETEAQQGRGAWKQITGENYGEKKAETWVREVPETLSATQLADLKADAARVRARILDLIREDGVAEGRKQASASDAEIAKLQLLADNVSTLQASVTSLETRRAAAAATLADAERARKAMQLRFDDRGLTCPDCGSVLMIENGELAHHKPVTQPQGAASAAEIAAADKAVSDARAKLTREADAAFQAKRHVVDAQAAGDTLARMRQAMPTGARTQEEIKAEQATEQKRLDSMQARITEATKAADDAIAARKATKDAADAHAKVTAWKKVAAELAPDGIPGELLSRALSGINAILDDATPDGWRTPLIQPDCSITASGRAYHLLSESEQWMVDAVIGAAVARISKLRLLVLDRMDVLEPGKRNTLLSWLVGQIQGGELETCLVMATLKGKMNVDAVPDTICHWLGDEEKSMAKAA